MAQPNAEKAANVALQLVHKVVRNNVQSTSSISSEDDTISKMTHLYLQGKGIVSLGNLSKLQNLTVAYLYDNEIESLEDLGSLRHLTHLYLQNNRVNRIKGLYNLTKLKKLYLSHNYIGKLEGLEACTSLEELHLAYQKPLCNFGSSSEHLEFDTKSLAAIGPTLQFLDISFTSARHVAEINALWRLRELHMQQTAISDMDEVIPILRSCTNLHFLNLSNTKISKAQNYRKLVVIEALNLAVLDGKTVLPGERKFLQNLRRQKQQQQEQQQKQSMVPRKVNKTSKTEERVSSLDSVYSSELTTSQ